MTQENKIKKIVNYIVNINVIENFNKLNLKQIENIVNGFLNTKTFKKMLVKFKFLENENRDLNVELKQKIKDGLKERNLELRLTNDEVRKEKDIVNELTEYLKETKNPSEKLLVLALEFDIDFIKYIENPSNYIKMVAVDIEPSIVSQFNENMSDELKMYAVEKDWKLIEKIKNPSYEVLYKAAFCGGCNDKNFLSSLPDEVKINLLKASRITGGCFKNIKQESIEVQTEALKLKNVCPKFILENNTNEDVLLAAVKICGDWIKHIKNPSEKIKLEAVKSNGSAIQYLNESDLTEKVKLAAVRQNGLVLKYLKAPLKHIEEEAMKQNIYSIQYIEDLPEYKQMQIINNDIDMIRYIKNPSEMVQLEVVKQKPDLIKHIKKQSSLAQLEAFKTKLNREPYNIFMFMENIHNPSIEVIDEFLCLDLDGGYYNYNSLDSYIEARRNDIKSVF